MNTNNSGNSQKIAFERYLKVLNYTKTFFFILKLIRQYLSRAKEVTILSNYFLFINFTTVQLES